MSVFFFFLETRVMGVSSSYPGCLVWLLSRAGVLENQSSLVLFPDVGRVSL
jgi:hypothetical protein